MPKLPHSLSYTKEENGKGEKFSSRNYLTLTHKDLVLGLAMSLWLGFLLGVALQFLFQIY